MPKRNRGAETSRSRKRRKIMTSSWLRKYNAERPQGFVNVGNLCYRLCLMQCLMHTPAFLRWIENVHKVRPIPPANPSVRRSARLAYKLQPPRPTPALPAVHPAANCVLCRFQNLVQAYWMNRSRAAFPLDSQDIGVLAQLWRTMIANIVPGVTSQETATILRSTQQQDPEEFWSALLEMLGPGSKVWPTDRMFQMQAITERDCGYCGRQYFPPNTGCQAIIALSIPHQPIDVTLEMLLDNYFIERVTSNTRCPYRGCRSRGHPHSVPTFHTAPPTKEDEGEQGEEKEMEEGNDDDEDKSSTDASPTGSMQSSIQHSSPNSLFDEIITDPVRPAARQMSQRSIPDTFDSPDLPFHGSENSSITVVPRRTDQKRSSDFSHDSSPRGSNIVIPPRRSNLQSTLKALSGGTNDDFDNDKEEEDEDDNDNEDKNHNGKANNPTSRPPLINALPNIRIDTIRISHSPPVLLITLKRYVVENTQAHKISTFIPHPLELDLTRHAHPSLGAQALRYRLQGLICHHGRSLDEGHYVAVVREREGDRSAIINDHVVHRFDGLDVLRRPHAVREGKDFDVYGLMYMRVFDEE